MGEASRVRPINVHPSPLDFPPAGRSRLLSGPELFLSWTRPAVTSAGIAGHAAHKTMQLQVQVDQAQALRRGINAPFSTVKFEVDPAQLSPEVREEIASNLLEGFRLNANITVVEPSLAGLISVIDRRLKVLAEKKAKAEELKKLRIAFSNAVVADPEKYVEDDGAPGTYEWRCRLVGVPSYVSDSDGEIKTSDWCFPICRSGDDISEEATAAATAVYQRRLAMHEAAHAELEKKRVAEEADKNARIKARRFALSNALSDDDRERFDAGYMDEDEAVKFVADAYRASLGLELTGGAKQWGVDDFYEAKTLSASAFSALKAFKQKIPEGATCKVFRGEGAVRKIVAEATFPHPTIPGVEIVADCLLEEVDLEASE